MVARKSKGEPEFDGTDKSSSESDTDKEELSSGSESDEESDRGDSEHTIQEDVDNQVKIKPISSPTGENCTFDLRNLLAMNSHQVETAKLYLTKKEGDEEITIPTKSSLIASVDEDHLLEKATDGCTQLINALWQLPTERSDVGPIASLPSFFVTKLPRQLPPPPPKQETKWEKFAKQKGIPLNKSKRSQKVWDEAAETWKFRHGYNKANDDAKEWPIMEVKKNDDPFEDPWDRARDAKRDRVDKNMENRMRNAERAGEVSKGTTNRTVKNQKKNRKEAKKGGNIDKNGIPIGVPVDLPTRKGSETTNPKKRGRENTVKALLATQRSTASLGNFDAIRKGEPDRKKALSGLKKRKFESATDRKVVSSEADRGMKVLTAVMNGGGKEREKAKRKGHLAKGETAYDFEYDDGLGPSKFRKKKGRAGAGKMKKMTKKRVV
mmetsp:Transcript_10112/g.14833  ORF Transcript_10112/g.14833 Transcript_10112/m.14833 type:complete len:437 (-) Transcript_10112:1119-2429(-)|eukprot:CAMPEP_0194203596 /NCGR_PEP_ID=MMETSP0156-20130528/3319_1 /TAXON_ID=33649 /ORGANISM="Thalassionema nitzschioides, Strain L26-B" /LENGTH=436 /DNA_ID=CAMNT_0038929373 /DNA_START=26 /DNA_END=1336 /DNA_ORIENTATION=-